MPRPGPRPYECVKRAWHSDRHQPVRGSLIREIFRIANEIHSPATRKNKEWQEKLPSVVLKAEEIMYSKANSEAEYVDLSTLWERANDAVDTIIRRDDVNESGDLLQPCIEAALTLGCIPRRASRSQRHSNPRFYLTSSPQEAAKPPPATHSMLHSSRPQMGPAAYLLQPPLLGCAGRSLHSCSTQSTPWMPGPPNAPPHGCPPLEMAYPSAAAPSINNQNEAFRYPADDSPLCNRQGKTLLLEALNQATMGRVYPLYYGTMTHNVESSSSFLEPVGSSCNGLTVGSAPCGSSARELPGNANGYATPPLNDPTNVRDTANAGCDLSLRLGRPSVATPLVLAEDGWVPEVEDMGSSSSLDGGSKFHEPSQGQPPLIRAINFGCSFLPPQNHHKGMLLSYMEGPGEPLESCSSKRSLEDEDTLYVETSDRKRKALHDDPLVVDYGRLRWKLTHSAGQQLHTSERLDS